MVALIIILIIPIGLFLALRKRFNLLSYHSFMIQIALLLLLAVAMTSYVFINWGHFKQYEGPGDADFWTVKITIGVMTYVLIASATFLLASVVSVFVRNRKKKSL
jgi:hypothetical protein